MSRYVDIFDGIPGLTKVVKGDVFRQNTINEYTLMETSKGGAYFVDVERCMIRTDHVYDAETSLHDVLTRNPSWKPYKIKHVGMESFPEGTIIKTITYRGKSEIFTVVYLDTPNGRYYGLMDKNNRVTDSFHIINATGITRRQLEDFVSGSSVYEKLYVDIDSNGEH